MGNQTCLCCQREGTNGGGKEENLSVHNTIGKNLPSLPGLDQDSFNNIFEQKLHEFGEYSTINELNDHLSDRVRGSVSESPYDISKYSTTNSKVYTARPVQFKNGNIYAGNWNENVEMEGYGKLFLKNDGVLAEGVWKGGVLTNGRIYFPNGDIYEGSVENSTFEGKGTLYFSDGVVYKGEFRAGERSGSGIQTYPDGSIYDGQFENDVFNGQGDFKWSNGYRYVGTFDNAQLNGRGILTNEHNKSIFEGVFYKNTFHGKGNYTWGNSESTFEGSYENGIKQGKGVLKKKNGFVYRGGFLDNKPHGYGEVEIGSKKYKCTWRNGETVEVPTIIGNQPTFANNYNSDKDKIEIDLNFEVDMEDMDPKELKYLYFEEYVPKDEKNQNGGMSYRPIENFTE